jgi:hypothetical protein
VTYSQNFRRGFPLSALLLLCLVALGCAFPFSKKQSSAVIEEAYIDLKQGFSLVIPAIWTRERIPVSSPRYNPNTVEWLINSTDGYEGTFQISVQSAIPLQQYLSNLENEHLKLTENMSENMIHPAGPALRWELEDKQESIILITIEGSERRHIITARVAKMNYSQLRKSIERVINSFLILPN